MVARKIFKNISPKTIDFHPKEAYNKCIGSERIREKSKRQKKKRRIVMDAVECIKNLRRLCESQADCHECPLHENCKEGGNVYCIAVYCIADVSEYAEKAVQIVEQWAKEHPIKTRQSEFLKIFPNARIDDSGVLLLCPNDFLPAGARSTYCEKHENCKECRKDCWLAEVTDND